MKKYTAQSNLTLAGKLVKAGATVELDEKSPSTASLFKHGQILDPTAKPTDAPKGEGKEGK